MSINFGLLGLTPVDRSLTPKGAPGPQLFNAMMKNRALNIQEAGLFGNLQARQNELQESKRANLAQEADRAAGRDIQRESMAQQESQFKRTISLDKEKVQLLKDKFAHQIDEDMFQRGITQGDADLRQASFAQSLVEAERQYQLKAELGRGHLEINKLNAMTNQERLDFQRQEVEREREANKLIADTLDSEGFEAAALKTMELKGPSEAMPMIEAFSKVQSQTDKILNGDMDAAETSALVGTLSSEGVVFGNELEGKQREDYFLGIAKDINSLNSGIKIDTSSADAAEADIQHIALATQTQRDAWVRSAQAGNRAAQKVLGGMFGADDPTRRKAEEMLLKREDSLSNVYAPPEDLMSTSEYVRLKNEGSKLSDSDKGKIATKMNEAELAVTDLEQIAKTDFQEFTQYSGQLGAAWARTKEKLGVPLAEADEDAIIRAAEAEGRVGRVLAKILKLMSGAAVSDSEFKRTAQNQISMNMSPTQIKTMLIDLQEEGLRTVNQSRARLGQPLRKRIKFEEPAQRQQAPVTQTVGVFNNSFTDAGVSTGHWTDKFE